MELDIEALKSSAGFAELSIDTARVTLETYFRALELHDIGIANCYNDKQVRCIFFYNIFMKLRNKKES